MNKKVIVFDLDGTLAESKSAITDEMSELLGELLEKYHVCIISGGKFGQFESQLLANLKIGHNSKEWLHLMPTCGTRYYRFENIKEEWQQMYAEDFTEAEKKKIITALKDGAKELGLWEEKPWGDIVEDRGSQITFSALGQEAPVDAKKKWDPDGTKKKKLRDWVAERIPEFEVRTGGTTSVDITGLGIDKAYGMNKLMETLEVSKEEILFMGDALHEGGNDYPVKAMGIDSISVDSPEETEKLIQACIYLAN